MATQAKNTTTTETVPVTIENLIRAESHMYMGAVVKKGGFGKVEHNRELAPIYAQSI